MATTLLSTQLHSTYHLAKQLRDVGDDPAVVAALSRLKLPAATDRDGTTHTARCLGHPGPDDRPEVPATWLAGRILHRCFNDYRTGPLLDTVVRAAVGIDCWYDLVVTEAAAVVLRHGLPRPQLLHGDRDGTADRLEQAAAAAARRLAGDRRTVDVLAAGRALQHGDTPMPDAIRDELAHRSLGHRHDAIVEHLDRIHPDRDRGAAARRCRTARTSVDAAAGHRWFIITTRNLHNVHHNHDEPSPAAVARRILNELADDQVTVGNAVALRVPAGPARLAVGTAALTDPLEDLDRTTVTTALRLWDPAGRDGGSYANLTDAAAAAVKLAR